MQPVLFEVASIVVYGYGLMIALGIVGGMAYLVAEGKKVAGLTFDQANMLFLFIFLAAIVGGKVFLFLEDPIYYSGNPGQLLTGRGFVFYGSFLLAIPAMLWFFRKHGLSAYRMLDVMAISTCIVHLFGRIGCFLAGCCYGRPTDSWLGVVYRNPQCYAEPLNTPLFPTQPMEAAFILCLMVFLLSRRRKKSFDGQLFLTYLIVYAGGRFVLEFFRGDVGRGFIVGDLLSHSQLIALSIVGVVTVIYFRWSRPAVGN